jgi:hypothetical protein
VTAILAKNPSLTSEARKIMNAMLPEVKAATQGKAIIISQTQLDGIISILNAVGSEASPVLTQSIQRIKRDLRQKKALEKMGIKISH